MRQIVKDANIFDGTGSALFKASVIIEDGRITSIVSDNSIDAQAGDTVIDAKGKTLMPGMIDAHSHLTWASSVEKIYHQFMLPPEELKTAAWRNARVLLESGFTSLYSAGALGDGIEQELAKAIESGDTVGARLIPSTLERSPEGDDTGDVFNGRGPDAMRGFVKHCHDTGVKIVKLVISGEDAIAPGTSQDILYTEEELKACQEECEKYGLWMSAHVYHPKAIQLAIKYGVKMLYHCSFADEKTIALMAKHKDEIFYAPGPGVSVAAIQATPPPHIDMTSMKDSAKERLALEKTLVPELKKRGVRILIGGDYGFPFNPNGTNARDLAHFVEYYSYTPAEALCAATMLGGQLMGMGDELGLVREGYIADLILINGDPTGDISIMTDRSKLHMIMQAGTIYTPQANEEAAP